MSDSNRAADGQEETIPVWMRAVDESTLYDAPSTSSSDEQDYADEDMRFAQRRDRPVAHGSAESADDAPSNALRRKMAVLMDNPASGPSPSPDQVPKMIGYVSPEIERCFQLAAAALRSRYTDGPSNSLLLECALQTVLEDLWNEGSESALVRHLDSVLRKG